MEPVHQDSFRYPGLLLMFEREVGYSLGLAERVRPVSSQVLPFVDLLLHCLPGDPSHFPYRWSPLQVSVGSGCKHCLGHTAQAIVRLIPPGRTVDFSCLGCEFSPSCTGSLGSCQH